MATTPTARDSRRKRILEKGSDRLALITGRFQNLPQSYLTRTVSSPELSFDAQQQQSYRSAQSSVPFHGDADAPDTAAAKEEINNENASNAAIGTESRMEPRLRRESRLRKCETSVYERAAPLDTSSKRPSSLALSSAAQKVYNSIIEAERHTEPQGHHYRIFTPSRISSSVSASKRTRLLCSISIALLVLSHLRFPLLGSSFVRSIIMPRPVYILLLTDATLVLAWLLVQKEGHYDKAQEEAGEESSEDWFGWAEGVKALEMMLVLHKVIGAAFLDCSVYVVIVVCGLSLIQPWL